MNQRDRLTTTVIIWIIFIVLILMVFDRTLFVQADFLGLWPQMSGYPMAQDAEALTQVIATARDASPALLERVQGDVQNQLATRVPLATVMAFMLMTAASAATWFVWRNAGLEAYLAREVVQAEKAKRRSRIEQFMEDLDSDELAQLRDRLSDDASARAKR